MHLYTFTISHFSEKARWALDRSGLPYTEVPLVPGPHRLTTKRLGGRSHVPLLKTPSEAIQGSGNILDYLAAREDSAAEWDESARTLETEFDDVIGKGLQTIYYATLLNDRRLVTNLWSQRGPFWARPIYALAFPKVKEAVERMYRTTDSAYVDECKNKLFSLLEKTDSLLLQRRYLAGTSPGRLDFTLASLLSPLCQPKEHVADWPSSPPALLDFESRARQFHTHSHVLRLYKEHR